MIDEKFGRTMLLIGEDSINRLKGSRVCVFGLGGVGGYVVEALVRGGVGAIDIVDNDVISETNINRQIYATTLNIGRYKTELAKERILSINPNCKVIAYNMFFLPNTSSQIDFSVYDYVVDAIDTITGKLEIIKRAKEINVPVISSMGTGNKLDPTLFRVSDIYSTSICPLAKVMRRLCKENNIKELKVVYSTELPKKDLYSVELSEKTSKRQTPGSISFVPPTAGLIIGGEVIKDLISKR